METPLMPSLSRSTRPNPAIPTPSSLTPSYRASAIHISSRIQWGVAGGSWGINKSKPTGSDVTSCDGISHLYIPSCWRFCWAREQWFWMKSKYQLLLSRPTSQRATEGSLDSSSSWMCVCVCVCFARGCLWRPRRSGGFRSPPVFHIKPSLQKESSNSRTARAIHASLGCRRADADISKSFFF